MMGRSAMMVSSRGLIRTVSFHPFSLASFGMMMLSHVTRLSTWTSIEVEVDRVGVHAVVGDPPDLGAVLGVADRRDLDVLDRFIPVTESVVTTCLGSLVPSMSSVCGLTNGIERDAVP
jgi:hypothetical protein